MSRIDLPQLPDSVRRFALLSMLVSTLPPRRARLSFAFAVLAIFTLEVGMPNASAELRTGSRVGADLAWQTIEAETMQTNGELLGPNYEPFRLETESSGQRCVKLATAGKFLEFKASAAASAAVIRYSLPDAPGGGGTKSELTLIINGDQERTLALASTYSWLYGNYPFTNRPADGKPRNFYDEVRVKGLRIHAGDTVRIEKSGSGPACTVDLVDLENVAPPIEAPAGALSITDFGAKSGVDLENSNDATEPLKKAIAQLGSKGGVVWVPAGSYRITGDIVVPSHTTIQGAGMWHTTFVGDESTYANAAKRVRFKLSGEDVHLADFAIVGRLNYRNDEEANDGVLGAGCVDASIKRLWIEHTKVGIWVYNGTRVMIEGCRFRNTLADGENLCVGTNHSTVENCTARGTGDDCFAIWPVPGDQGHAENAKPGHNVIRRCTGQLTFLANGGALYGGESNRIEDCLFTDIGTGCGILISTTFPTSDDARKIDNNFSGTTTVENCQLLRCGGYDHSWAYRGSIQICLDRKSISGLLLKNIDVAQSLSDAITIVAPGSAKGQGTLSNAQFKSVSAENSGLGTKLDHGLFVRADGAGAVTLVDSDLAPIQNESGHFEVVKSR